MNARELLDAFVLEQIASQPLAQRALLYRGFAAEATSKEIKSAAHALADECEAIERRHDQLVLDFKRRAL